MSEPTPRVPGAAPSRLHVVPPSGPVPAERLERGRRRDRCRVPEPTRSARSDGPGIVAGRGAYLARRQTLGDAGREGEAEQMPGEAAAGGGDGASRRCASGKSWGAARQRDARPRRRVPRGRPLDRLQASDPSLEDEVRNLLVGRETIESGLREDQVALDGDLESPTAALDELDLRVREDGRDLGGQTGRLRSVVSLHAEFDRDVHVGCSWCASGTEGRGAGPRSSVTLPALARSGPLWPGLEQSGPAPTTAELISWDGKSPHLHPQTVAITVSKRPVGLLEEPVRASVRHH